MSAPLSHAPSPGEEIANGISHGIGLLAALAGAPILIATAAAHGTRAVVGAAVFSSALLVLCASSTLYHALPFERVKRVFRFLDHAAIFLLIAGTYTPFTLTVLRGPWGWSLFAAVWGLALLGITLRAFGVLLRHPALATSLYLAMGWLVVVAIRPLWLHLAGPGLAWLVAGGLFYTFGVPFYVAERRRYAHFVWHLFVLGGAACHYVAILGWAV